MYFTLGNIDPAQRSKLDSIQLIALFPCQLLMEYSIDAVLAPFYEDIHTTVKGMYDAVSYM